MDISHFLFIVTAQTFGGLRCCKIIGETNETGTLLLKTIAANKSCKKMNYTNFQELRFCGKLRGK